MLTIGQVGLRTGLAVSAIRYYEEQGLITPGRNAGGQRRFERADIRRISFIKIAQQMGYSIAEIRGELSALPEGRTPTKADWEKIARHFRKSLDEKIATLTRLRESLNSCIGCGCLSLKSCKLYNPDDALRTHGPGPRILLGDRLGEA